MTIESVALAPQPAISSLTINGVAEPIVLRYFETLNQGDFAATSDLFAIDGALHPPFESMVIGPEAIEAYLHTEAQGLTLLPVEGQEQVLDNGCTEIQVGGRVRTAWFEVNVSWRFILSPTKEIFLVQVKLLASPQELLSLRR